MSKGIGQGYINRMKRYHLPKIKNVRDRISTICDRAFYHESSFKYKLPRYYRDRLYRMKFPCDARVWNKKLNQYENKIVYRYKSKNPLAVQMSVEVRNRVLADFNRRFSELRATYPNYSDTKILRTLSMAETASRMDRQKDCFSKMSRFYNHNRFKNRKF